MDIGREATHVIRSLFVAVSGHKWTIIFFIGVAAILPTAILTDLMNWSFWSEPVIPGGDTRSAVVRNLGLLTFAVLGVTIAYWRTATADRQTRISEAGLNIDRFQKGAELLTDEKTHFAGLQTLRDLAIADPANHYRQVVEQIANFVRQISMEAIEENRGKENPEICHRSIRDGIGIICELSNDKDLRGKAEIPEGNWPDLTETYLCGAAFERLSFAEMDLAKANLRATNLYFCDFTRANLKEADLCKCPIGEGGFRGADLDSAQFKHAVFFRVDLTEANASNADFENAKMSYVNLSQTFFGTAKNMVPEMLELAWAWVDAEPRLPEGFSLRSEHLIDSDIRDEYEIQQKTGLPGLRI